MPIGVWTTDHILYPYHEAGISVDHEWCEGTILLPVAGVPGAPAEIVRLHAPYGTRKTHSYGMRKGSIPVMPDPTTIPAGAVLASYTVTTAAADIDTDSFSRIHQDRCEAVYLLTLPRSPADGYDYPCFPFDGTGTAGNVVGLTAFSSAVFPDLPAAVANPGGGMGRTS